jgi:hypothetical protein
MLTESSALEIYHWNQVLHVAMKINTDMHSTISESVAYTLPYTFFVRN